MNTFLVSGDFKQCARVLDTQRLNRQITETVSLVKTLFAYKLLRENFKEIPFVIQFPPVINLWIDDRGNIHFNALRSYFNAMHEEWKTRKKKGHNAVRRFSWDRFKDMLDGPTQLKWPREVYFSHRSKLLDKDFNYYNRQFMKEKLDGFEETNGYTWEGPDI